MEVGNAFTLKTIAMKAKILTLACGIFMLATSCASHCNADSWRKRRFVENVKPAPVMAQPEVKG